ncbi:hypothetical protein AAFC00_003895 [Neodothiora populina]|uniref:Ubiquitin-like-conjugating enzyme ATG10 n=1 Tax=Neodothiora populina TaxID=2781224 RepID=A0ABR3PFR0_9PEZI
MTKVLSHFPFITVEEFEEACRHIDRWSEFELSLAGPVSLKLSKSTSLNAIHKPDEDGDENEVNEDDEELLQSDSNVPPAVRLDYEIMLSTSYRVPVVYMQCRDSYLSIDQVYDALVPASGSSAMRAVGVLGALSMTDHPLTGLPAYFVHPCRTAEAIRSSSASSQMDPLAYMMLWFGVIGSSVGLSVPTKVALHSNICN